MHNPADRVTATLRIPGAWRNPGELLAQMPAGCRLTEEFLYLPDGARYVFDVRPADDRFAQVFRTACRDQPTKEELKTIDAYTINALVQGTGGSLEAARGLMRAAAALVQAGGAGVFIDNSALAHGGETWLELADDGSPDAASFAFVSIVRGRAEVWTMGLHVLGLRDIVAKRSDIEEKFFDFVELIRYVAKGEPAIEDGHVIADQDGPRFRAALEDDARDKTDSPMHNPFGRLRLVSWKDLAELN